MTTPDHPDDVQILEVNEENKATTREFGTYQQDVSQEEESKSQFLQKEEEEHLSSKFVSEVAEKHYARFSKKINHQKSPRFLWKGTRWEFACFPPSLASALRVFTKIMKPVVGMLQKMGATLIVYLDDIFIMPESQQLTNQQYQLVFSILII